MKLHTHSSILLTVLLLVGGLHLVSCQESASSIGIDYYKDTVSYKTDTLTSGSSFFTFTPMTTSRVLIGSRPYNLNVSSPLLFVGRAKQGTEDMEAWGVLRFPTLGSDTLAKAKSVRLLLYTVAYKYGPDSTNTNVDLQVYAQEGGGTISDSSTDVNPSELTTTAIGSFTGAVIDSTGTQIAIPIAESEIPKLSATSFAFVVEPGTTMNHVRAFSTADASSLQPLIEYTVQTDTGLMTITRKPALDFHVIKDRSQPTTGELETRGSVAKRVRLDFNLRAFQDSLNLTRYSTINSAVIELHADLTNSRQSNLTFDTSGPTIVRLTGSADSATAIYGVMTRVSGSSDVFRISFGNLVELWMRDSTTYHGLEVRAGWNNRLFGSTYAGVEDNSLNRFSFYGPDAADVTKRPRIFISHSTLK